MIRPTSPLVCGPLLRHVSRDSAVIWVEVAEPLEVEVQLTPRAVGGVGVPQTARAWAVQVEDSYYAWVACEWLLPQVWYTHRIIGHRPDGSTVELWPDPRFTGIALPSAFRTLPEWSFDRLRIAFGSCRKGFPPEDPRAEEAGLDAFRGLAALLAQEWEHRDDVWPHLLLLVGDQIYADDLSAGLQAKFHRMPSPFGAEDAATTFQQFAEIYREAWTGTPDVRWLLSCIPSFMVFDDHEMVDDWNITQQWVEARLGGPEWRRRITAGLMAYWIYQGAGNLPPSAWRTDERMRPLTPRLAPAVGNVTPALSRLFEAYVRRTRRASWGYAVDVAGTRIAVADTRMSRKLTGRRLLMDDVAWGEFVALAKQHPRRRVLLVIPGPMLLPHPMHDLLSWIAERLETDKPSLQGAIGGAIVGGLIGGPIGAVIGAGIGAIAVEEVIDAMLPGKIESYDAELWSVFPSSFNRLLSLLEDLTEGVGTIRKSFVALIAGDIHHSHVMRGDLLKTRRRASVLQFTLSPIRNVIGEESRKDLKKAMVGDVPWYLDLIADRPDFVEDQMQRLHWYPLRMDGSRADPGNPDEWAHFGTFLGWLDLEGSRVTYRYDRAVSGGPVGVRLEPIGQVNLLTV